MLFKDRSDAGHRLARRLDHLRGPDLVVLGLPRGGVPVAYEVAIALDAPLDVILVRKLGVPFQPELGMGAIGEGGVRVLDPEIVAMARVSDADLATVEWREREVLRRRAERFRGGRPRVPLTGKVALVVDDGIATGSTARAACRVAREAGAARVVLAVPVGPADCARRFAGEADEFVCLENPDPFYAVGEFYADFTQTPDEEVVRRLDDAGRRVPVGEPDPNDCDDPPVADRAVTVAIDRRTSLAGHLFLPSAAAPVIVFAHGSGSSRHSPRNRFVAEVLHRAGMGTLLIDLLTKDEELDRDNVFDIERLADRLVTLTGWLTNETGTAGVDMGLFGASTGAGAALWAASQPGAEVGAVVSRGGRPDLASPRLAAVRAPTLLIVGSHDEIVLELNRRALAELRCVRRLEVVSGATHLFEEPGTLARAAELARDWFGEHLMGRAR